MQQYAQQHLERQLRTTARTPRRTAAAASPPQCWLCLRQCGSFGWTQAHPGGAQRMCFHPASLFTLCLPCARATSASPTVPNVDVMQSAHPSTAARGHSTAYVQFLRDYKRLLEDLHLSTRGREGSAGASGLPRHALTALREEVGVALGDREVITLKEAHTLLAEDTALHAALQETPARHSYPSPHRHETPRQFAAWGDTTGPAAMELQPLGLNVTPAAHTAYGGQATGQRKAIVTDDGEVYVLADPARPAVSLSHSTTPARGTARGPTTEGPSVRPAAHRPLFGDDVTPAVTPRAPAAPPALPTEDVAAAAAHGASAYPRPVAVPGVRSASLPMDDAAERLLRATEEVAALQEASETAATAASAETARLRQEVDSLRRAAETAARRAEAAEADRDELRARLAHLEGQRRAVPAEAALLMERAVSAAFATAALCADHAVAHGGLAVGEAIAAAEGSAQSVGQLHRAREQLEVSQVQLRQQQKMLEASRRAVMHAWADGATSGDNALGTAPVAPLPQLPPLDSDTTMF